MRIVYWGNGNRGVACLRALHKRGPAPELIVAHPQGRPQWYASVAETAAELDLEIIAPQDPNDSVTQDQLKDVGADLFILAGYGRILRRSVVDIPRLMSINLHAGKVPEYRGSSPLNWALINGEHSFGLSILKLGGADSTHSAGARAAGWTGSAGDSTRVAGGGVDSGDVLLQREFEISTNDTIRELHAIADEQFPAMLVEVVGQLETDACSLKPQDPSRARYFPLRFPDDGLILWDQLTADQIHNRIRALTEPYPCAFTFHAGREARLVASELARSRHCGEPGRIYRKTDQGLLVCAADECLWIRHARFADDDSPLAGAVERYDRLATVAGLSLERLRREDRR